LEISVTVIFSTHSEVTLTPKVMEEEDELVPDPDDKGCLNLSNRAWVHLDAAIWTMSTRLVKLDISYNHILELPSQIGELVMLR
jgi:hypothetical protein